MVSKFTSFSPQTGKHGINQMPPGFVELDDELLERMQGGFDLDSEPKEEDVEEEDIEPTSEPLAGELGDSGDTP